MKCIDDFVMGFKAGAQRREILAFCRAQGEEYQRGRAADTEGKSIWDRVGEVQGIEVKTLGERAYDFGEGGMRRTRLWSPRGLGYVSYQLLHPINFYRDEWLITDIVINEVRPV